MKLAFATSAVLAALSMTVGAGSASAATFIAGGSATVEGAGSSQLPLGNGSVTSMTSQFLFSAAQLGGLTAGSVITSIGFRVNVNSPAQTQAMTYSNYQISLGSSTQAVGSLTANFAANQGADTVTVRNGAMTIAANTFTSQPFQSSATPTPNPFYTIDFATPFTYTGGNLLLTLTMATSTPRGLILDATPYAAGGGLDSVSNVNPLSTPTQFYSIPIVQFTTAAATAGVPEPATWAMMMLGFGAMGASLRRRAKVRTAVTYA